MDCPNGHSDLVIKFCLQPSYLLLEGEKRFYLHGSLGVLSTEKDSFLTCKPSVPGDYDTLHSAIVSHNDRHLRSYFTPDKETKYHLPLWLKNSV